MEKARSHPLTDSQFTATKKEFSDSEEDGEQGTFLSLTFGSGIKA